jgi:hypothetical protein
MTIDFTPRAALLGRVLLGPLPNRLEFVVGCLSI